MGDKPDSEDAKLEQDFTELQEVENEIKKLEKEQEDKMVELDKEFLVKKRPLFNERIKICSRIPNFWLNALLNHRELQYYINTSDYDCLRHLKELDITEIEEEGYQGTRYHFKFDKNPFFENSEIYKEFKYNKETGGLEVDQSPIKWKEGMNLNQKGSDGADKGKKRDASEMENSSFFGWFDGDEDCESPIGEWFREDIWKDPFKYFCGEDEDDDADDAEGGMDDEGDEEDEEEEDDDGEDEEDGE